MRLSDVPDLIRDGGRVSVREVSEPSRYDVRLSIGFTGAVSDDDVAWLERLGGRVDRVSQLGIVFGVLPDRSIPAVRTQAGVAWIEVASVYCLA
jgi:hypothetical protein